MTDTFWPDTSNSQSSIDFAALRAFTPVNSSQVCWGTNPTINETPGRIAAVRAENFAINIWYIGIVWNQDIQAQVNTFTSLIPTLLPNETIFIDWESSLGGMPTAAQRDQMAALLAAFYKIDVKYIGIYGSPDNLKAAFPNAWTILADYGPPNGEPSSPPHTVWQYTNGQIPSPPYQPINYPGIGFCDSNVFHGSVAQLAAIVLPQPQPQEEDPVGSSSLFKRTTVNSVPEQAGAPALVKGCSIVVEINPAKDVYVKNGAPGAPPGPSNQCVAHNVIPGTLAGDLNPNGTGVEGVWQNEPDGSMTYFNIPGDLNLDGTVLVGQKNIP